MRRLSFVSIWRRRAGSVEVPVQAETIDLIGNPHVGPDAIAVPRRNRWVEERMGAEVRKEIFNLERHVLPDGELPFGTAADGPARQRCRIRNSEPRSRNSEPRSQGIERINIKLGEGGAASHIEEKVRGRRETQAAAGGREPAFLCLVLEDCVERRKVASVPRLVRPRKVPLSPNNHLWRNLIVAAHGATHEAAAAQVEFTR